MILYILRHAEAIRREDSIPDQDRPLTSDGIKTMKAAALGMHALKMKVDLVLSSPLVRARQTAEIAAAALGGSNNVTLTKNLTPDADTETLIAELAQKYSSRKDIMLVGHEPDLGRLASVLLIGTSDLPVVFKKGGLMALELDSAPGKRGATLKWFLTARQLGLLSQ
jgi:phosphohistidine phosphatase